MNQGFINQLNIDAALLSQLQYNCKHDGTRLAKISELIHLP